MATGDTVLTDDSLIRRPEGLGIALTVPWYRSLWLSSVTDIAVAVEGREIPTDDLRVELGERTYRVDELAGPVGRPLVHPGPARRRRPARRAAGRGPGGRRRGDRRPAAALHADRADEVRDQPRDQPPVARRRWRAPDDHHRSRPRRRARRPGQRHQARTHAVLADQRVGRRPLRPARPARRRRRRGHRAGHRDRRLADDPHLSRGDRRVRPRVAGRLRPARLRAQLVRLQPRHGPPPRPRHDPRRGVRVHRHPVPQRARARLPAGAHPEREARR